MGFLLVGFLGKWVQAKEPAETGIAIDTGATIRVCCDEIP